MILDNEEVKDGVKYQLLLQDAKNLRKMTLAQKEEISILKKEIKERDVEIHTLHRLKLHYREKWESLKETIKALKELCVVISKS